MASLTAKFFQALPGNITFHPTFKKKIVIGLLTSTSVLCWGINKYFICFVISYRCYGAKVIGDLDAVEADVIIMEDMGKHGYAMVDRMAGLEADTCELLLKWLARLHGASVALRHLDPNEARRIESGITEIAYSRENPNIEQMQPIVENSASMQYATYYALPILDLLPL